MRPTACDVGKGVKLLGLDRQRFFDGTAGCKVVDGKEDRCLPRIGRRNQAGTQPKDAAAASFFVVNQLEMIGLWLPVQHRLEHGAELLIPGAPAQLVDSPADTLFGREAEHGVKTLVRCTDVELGVQNEQCFAAGTVGASHEP